MHWRCYLPQLSPLLELVTSCFFFFIFSAPEPKAQVHYRRPSLTVHISDSSSKTAERNSTKLDRKQDLNVLYQVCVFRADRKNKMAAMASDWLKHFRLLLWNRWLEFNDNWQEARSQHPLPSLCCSVRSEKQDGRSVWSVSKGGTLYSSARYVVLWAPCF